MSPRVRLDHGLLDQVLDAYAAHRRGAREGPLGIIPLARLQRVATPEVVAALAAEVMHWRLYAAGRLLAMSTRAEAGLEPGKGGGEPLMAYLDRHIGPLVAATEGAIDGAAFEHLKATLDEALDGRVHRRTPRAPDPLPIEDALDVARATVQRLRAEDARRQAKHRGA